ncbi:hypothetical protein Tco_1499641, partial [Tanacetum coccineum]
VRGAIGSRGRGGAARSRGGASGSIGRGAGGSRGASGSRGRGVGGSRGRGAGGSKRKPVSTARTQKRQAKWLELQDEPEQTQANSREPEQTTRLKHMSDQNQYVVLDKVEYNYEYWFGEDYRCRKHGKEMEMMRLVVAKSQVRFYKRLAYDIAQVLVHDYAMIKIDGALWKGAFQEQPHQAALRMPSARILQRSWENKAVVKTLP